MNASQYHGRWFRDLDEDERRAVRQLYCQGIVTLESWRAGWQRVILVTTTARES